MRRRLLAVAVVAAALTVPLVTAAPASAQGERIVRYDVTMQVSPDATVHVTEHISYDFGSVPHHGIERTFLTQTPYNNTHTRVYDVNDVRVSTDANTPGQTSINHSGSQETLRIGDPNRTITGVHDYTISYDLNGAMQTFSDHEELNWNVIGPAWPVPIYASTVTVSGPAGVTRATCFAGPVRSRLPCTRVRVVGGTARYAQNVLAPDDVLTVVAAFPKGSVATSTPVLHTRQTLARAFSATPVTLGATGLVLLALLAWLAWVWWVNGRDRRYIGQVPGLVPAKGQAVADEPRPLLDHTPVAVEFTPPEQVKPGEVGTLLDEQANTLDVTATIVDLAVRGYLKIEQIQPEHWYRSGDWKLTKTTTSTGDQPDPAQPDQTQPEQALQNFELTLYSALFDNRTEVTISELKGTFAADLQRVQNQLYDDVVSRGWFSRRPDIVRSQWLGVSLAILAAGAVTTYLLARNSRFGLVGVAVLFSGLVMLLLHNSMPARTARGSAMLARVIGFRRYLETAEAEQLKFEEKADVFARYLPFAIVFGVTEKWAHAFERLAAAQPEVATSAMGWYGGPPGWNIAFLAASLSNFTTSTSGVIASQPVSSSGLGGGFGSGFGGGGFAGGGGGGGGGGSW